MRVSEASEIICGQLINEPSIGSFEGFATKIEDVKRGVLFFALDRDEIDLALEKGAFGVVFDSQAQMRNVEVAWIKVDNIQHSLIRLVRYLLVGKKIEIILLSEIQYSIAKEIIRAKEVLFFDDCLSNFAGEPNRYSHYATNKDSPLSSTTQARLPIQELLDGIVKQNPRKIITSLQGIADLSIEEYTTCINPKHSPLDIITPHQIFESKFYHKVSAYQIPLPAVFLPELGAVVELCLREGDELSFELRDFAPLERLLPIALSPEAKILPLGKSNKVAIPTHSVEIFLRYAKYLKENAKFGELAFFVPRILGEKEMKIFAPIDENSDENDEYGGYSKVGFYLCEENLNDSSQKDENDREKLEAICYDSSNELPKMLKLERFNFALVLGISTEGLIFVLNEASKDTSPVLF
ncbi:hypothetical protein [Helicobacter sp. T3_23-1059]